MTTGHDDPNDSSRPNAPGRDQVTLSAQERQSLAHLEHRLRLDDPDFASRMRGYSWRWVRDLVGRWSCPTLPAWTGPALLIAGLAATLWAVDAVVWLSVVTVGVMVVGGLRVGQTVRVRLAGRQPSASTGSDATS